MRKLSLLALLLWSPTAHALTLELQPTRVVAGSPLGAFALIMREPAGVSLDSVALISPFPGHPISVTAVMVDGDSLKATMSGRPPQDSTYVSWLTIDDTCHLQLFPRAVLDSVEIHYVQDIPTKATTVSDTLTVNAFDPSGLELTTAGENRFPVAIAPGTRAQLTIETAADGNGEVVEYAHFRAGSEDHFYAILRDGFGNYIETVSASWTDEPPGLAHFSLADGGIFCEPESAGAGQIRATYEGLSTSRELIVSPGPAARIEIDDTEGTPMKDTLMVVYAHQTIALSANVLDEYDNQVTTAIKWGIDSTLYLDSVSQVLHPSATGREVLFTPNQPGRGLLSATLVDTSAVSQSIGVEVRLGYPDSASWTKNGDAYHDSALVTMSVDDSLTWTVRLYDDDSNLHDPTQVSFRHTFPAEAEVELSPIPGGCALTGRHHSAGSIIASLDYAGQSFEFATGPIHLIAGAPTELTILAQVDSASVGSLELACQRDTSLSVQVRDQYGNTVTDGQVIWTISPALYKNSESEVLFPTVSGYELLFAPNRPGSGWLSAALASNPGVSDRIPVTTLLGYPASVSWTKDGKAYDDSVLVTMSVDSSMTWAVRVYDDDGNPYGSARVSYAHSFPAEAGVVLSPISGGCALTGRHQSAGCIIASVEYGGKKFEFATGAIHLTAGAPAKLTILDQVGPTPVNTLTGLEMFCHQDTSLGVVVHDQYGNNIDSVAVVWGIAPTLYRNTASEVLFPSVLGNELLFSPDTTGSGWLSAAVADMPGVSSRIPVKTNLGYPVKASWTKNGESYVDSELVTMSVDDSLRWGVRIFDDDGNPHDVTNVSYRHTFAREANARLSPFPGGAVLYGQHPGSGSVIAELDYDGRRFEFATGPIQLTTGVPASLTILDQVGHAPVDTLTGLEMFCHQDTSLVVVVHDQYDNNIDSVAVVWGIDPTLYKNTASEVLFPSVLGNELLFSPDKTGSGWLSAAVADMPGVSSRVPVKTNLGYPVKASWTKDEKAYDDGALITMSVDDSLPWTVQLYDDDGNPHDSTQVTYRHTFAKETGVQVATFAGEGILTGQHPGSGSVTAALEYDGRSFEFSTGPIQLTAGVPASLTILDQVGPAPVDTLTGLEMFCHQDTSLGVVVHDQYDNNVDSVAVVWRIDPTLYKNTASEVLFPSVLGNELLFAPDTTGSGWLSAAVRDNPGVSSRILVKTNLGYPVKASWTKNGESYIDSELVKMSVDDSLTWTVQLYDDDGNPHDSTQVTYRHTFAKETGVQVATFAGEGILTGQHPGSGSVTAALEYDGRSFEFSTGPIQLTAGAPAELVIQDQVGPAPVDSLEIFCHQDTSLGVLVKDQHGNLVEDVGVVWSIDAALYRNSLSQVLYPSATGREVLFSPNQVGDGWVSAAVGGRPAVYQRLLVHVEPGYPDSASWTRDGESYDGTSLATMSVDDSLTWAVTLYDDDGNRHDPLQVSYRHTFAEEDSVQLTQVPGRCVLTGRHPGSGSIIATRQYDGQTFEFATGAIHLTAGAPERIALLSWPVGEPLAVDSLLVASLLSLHAAVFDRYFNPVEVDEDSLLWRAAPDSFAQFFSTDHGPDVVFQPLGAGDGVTIGVALGTTGLHQELGPFPILPVPWLEYLPGSLSPLMASPGDSVHFSMQVRSPQDRGTPLVLTTKTRLVIPAADTTQSISVYLARDTAVKAGGVVRLDFTPAAIPLYQPGETHSPELHLAGHCWNGSVSVEQALHTEPNSLCISNVLIEEVASRDAVGYPGTEHEVQVVLSNRGATAMRVLGLALLTRGTNGENGLTGQGDTATFVVPVGTTVIRSCSLIIGAEAQSDTVQLDAAIEVEGFQAPYTVSRALRGDRIRISPPPVVDVDLDSLGVNGRLSQQGVCTTTQGQAASTRLLLVNNGPVDVVLYQQSTLLMVGQGNPSHMAINADSLLIPASTMVSVGFDSLLAPPLGEHPLEIVLDGRDGNGFEYSRLLRPAGYLLVQSPPRLVVEDSGRASESGYPFIPEFRVENHGDVSAHAIGDSTQLSIRVGTLKLTQHLGGSVWIPAHAETTLAFQPITVSDTLADTLTMVLSLQGADANGFPFMHSWEASRPFLHPPYITSVAAYSPHTIVLGDTATFVLSNSISGSGAISFPPERSWVSLVLLDSLPDTVYRPIPLVAAQTIQAPGLAELRFATTTVPADTVLEPARLHVYLVSTDSLEREVVFEDTVELVAERRGMPVINHCELVDGGYLDLADEKVGEGDLIAVKFDRSVAPYSKTSVPAGRMFRFIDQYDGFGTVDSALVLPGSLVGYEGADADSLLFIELRDGCRVSLPWDDGVYRALAARSYLIVRPDIATGLLRDANGGDAGFACNSALLIAQLDRIEKARGGLSCPHAVEVFDPVGPFILNVAPQGDTIGLDRHSSFSDITAYVTGRNYVDRDSLRADLSALSLPADVDTLLMDYARLTMALRTLPPEQRLGLIQKYRNYWTEDIPLDRLALNPFSRMFAGVPEDGLQLAITDDGVMQSRPSVPFASVDTQATGDTLRNNLSISTDQGYHGPVSVQVECADYRQNHSTRSFSFAVGTLTSGIIRYTGEDFSVRTAPNPIRLGEEEMHVEYILPRDCQSVSLVFLDAGGQVVVRKALDKISVGRHLLPPNEGWNDGRNSGRNRVARGVYLCLLEVDGEIKASWRIVAE